LRVRYRNIYVERLAGSSIVVDHVGQGLVARSRIMRGFHLLSAFEVILVIDEYSQSLLTTLSSETALKSAPLLT